jgi:hypothetical protein
MHPDGAALIVIVIGGFTEHPRHIRNLGLANSQALKDGWLEAILSACGGNRPDFRVDRPEYPD